MTPPTFYRSLVASCGALLTISACSDSSENATNNAAASGTAGGISMPGTALGAAGAESTLGASGGMPAMVAEGVGAAGAGNATAGAGGSIDVGAGGAGNATAGAGGSVGMGGAGGMPGMPPRVVFDPADFPDEPFGDNPESVTIQNGIGWVEGPAWVPEEGGFIYNLSDRCGAGQSGCDIPDTHRIWRPGQEGTEEYWSVSGTNHGGIWSQGLVFMTNREPGRIGYIDPSQDPLEETVLSEGIKLGRPNDLDRFKDGSLYFSDWPNGIGGVHRLHMNGEIEEVISSGEIGGPNGIAFTVDCKILYVAAGGNVQALDVDDDGNLSNRRTAINAGSMNGIAVDIKGNVYTPNDRKVTVFNPDGEQIARWDPGQASVNMTFGGEDHRWLLVTSGSGVTAVRTQIPGGECFGLGTQRQTE